MPEWLIPLITIVGSVFGSYLGVRVAITRLEGQVTHIDKLITLHDNVIDQLEKRLVTLEGDSRRMKDDIGTHESGLRGAVHDHAQMLTKHELRLHALDKYPLQEL